jgi:hypothetical protein
MSVDEIRARIRRPWASVPVDVLENRQLSLAARAILAYLLDLGRRPEWVIRIRHVQTALGISQGVWQRHRAELQRAGYYSIARVRDEAGRIHWEHTLTDEPGTIGSFSTDGESIDGKSADIHSLSQHNPKGHAAQPASAPGVLPPSPKFSKPPRAPRVATKNPSIEELSTDPCVLATIGAVVEWLGTANAPADARQMRRVAASNLRRRKVRIVAGLLEHILEEAQRRASRLEEQSQDGKRRATDGDSAHIS